MTLFRPCIDLHAGAVKQIVGGTLSDPQQAAKTTELVTNFTSTHPAAYYASLYRKHGLTGAHVILLGPNNSTAAESALAAWPHALQVGGGVTPANAREWIAHGAAKVIVTSYLFPDGAYAPARLEEVLAALDNDRTKLVIDLSCRRVAQPDGSIRWFVATNKWTTVTAFEVNAANIKMLEAHCSEFLIHAADVEGLQRGIDQELVQKLGEWCSVPVTYAGGGRNLSDLELVGRSSGDKVDLTIGSALDIFGGKGVTLNECVAWNRSKGQPTPEGES